MEKKKRITESQRQDAARLKASYEKKNKSLGLTQQVMADALDITQGAVGHYLNGRNQLNISSAVVFAKMLQVDVSEFSPTLANEIAQLSNPKSDSGSSGISLTGLDLWDDQTPLSNDEVALPFFREVQLSAGHGSSMVQENGGAKLRFAKSTLRKCGVNEGSAACVTVSGNSMEPVLPDGATVGIDTEKTAIKDGKMFAIDHGGMLRVKILYRLPNGGIRLRSFNRDEWPDEDISGKEIDQVRIIGQVFWSSVLY